VRGDPGQRAEPARNLLVDEPAVGVEGDPDSRSGEGLDQLQGQVTPQERLAAGDDRLDDPEVEALGGDRPPLLVAQLRRALQRVARGIRVTEAAAQVAGVGDLQLGADRPLGALAQRSGRAAPEAPAQAPPGKALFATLGEQATRLRSGA
jgi:hypothetical protein